MPKINIVPQSLPAADETVDPISAYKRKQALAKALVEQATTGNEGVYSDLHGIAKVAAAGLGAWMHKDTYEKEQAAENAAANDAASIFSRSLEGTEPAPAASPIGKHSADNSPDDRHAAAIASIESGGRYDILGPKHPKYGHAVGKYQVMESNIPSWSMAALGRPLTTAEFRASPEAQEAVFKHRFGQYMAQYGNPQDAASAWFTGRPLAQGANRRDSLGTSGAEYVAKFNRAIGQAAQAKGTQVASLDPTVGVRQKPTGAVPPPAVSPGSGAEPAAALSVPGAAPTPPGSSAAPVQVAQAGGQPAGVSSPSLPKSKPFITAEEFKRLYANPRTRAEATALYNAEIQRQAAERQIKDIDGGNVIYRVNGAGQIVQTLPKAKDPTIIPEGGTALGPDGKVLYTAGPKQTDDQREYNLYVQQTRQAGKEPVDFTTWNRDNKKAGKTDVSVVNDLKAEGEEEKARGKGLATRLNTLADDGDVAQQDLIQLRRLGTLLGKVDPGSKTALLEGIRKKTGIALANNADDVQAVSALLEYQVPRLKVAGSGATSDRDMESFRSSLPSLLGTPGGNQVIMETLGGMATWRAARGEIAQRYQWGEIDAKTAMAEIRKLPDPFSSWKQHQEKAAAATAPTTVRTIRYRPDGTRIQE